LTHFLAAAKSAVVHKFFAELSQKTAIRPAWPAGKPTVCPPQNVLDLFARHALKPFEKIIRRRAAFKSLKQRCHWNPGALEDPGSAHLPWRSLDCLNAAPGHEPKK
jgi:hypothetical protein